MAFDIYAAVTDRIVQQLEQGVIPWHKPWTGLLLIVIITA